MFPYKSKEHLETEKTFRFVSKRLPLWKISGYSLGFFQHCFLETVGVVETFVEKHYMEQIKRYPEIIKLLKMEVHLLYLYVKKFN